MCTLPGTLSEKLNFKCVINPKIDFSGGQKCIKLHFDIKFHFLGVKLGNQELQNMLFDHHEIFRN